VINEQQVPSGRGPVQVNGLHLFVTSDNAFGLPAGSELIVAHAGTRAKPF
jgi:hypothetical protein